MSLKLIVGPPNSGRAGVIRERFNEALGRDPILVVPTLDDVEVFEAELCREGAVLGGSIRTLGVLFEEVARAAGAAAAPPLTGAQRLRVVRAAVERMRPRILARSAERPGFAPALDELISELQAAGMDPQSFAARVDEAGARPYHVELAALYAAYAELRDELGFGDEHTRASAAVSALRADPGAWGDRPVLLYGFDDLTAEQLELVGALAAASEVTVALTYEDRDALRARANLLASLREDHGGEIERELEPDSAHTASETLFHLERHFLVEEAEPREPDGGLILYEAAGERAQVEQIGAQIAALLADGTDPDEIAVVLRTPDSAALLYQQVLSSFEIPVAVEARIPLSSTATGKGLIDLLGALFSSRRARDVLGFLRTPGRASPNRVDWLERAIRRGRLRSAEEALEAWDDDLWEVTALREASSPADLCRATARLARAIAEFPHYRRAERLEERDRVELVAAKHLASAAEELAEVAELAPGPVELIDFLRDLRVPLWSGPTRGRVRVLSPYRARVRRVQHLFVASLQEAEFPRRDAGGPLLSDDELAELGVARAKREDEERYLFYVSLSRPTERLYLCHRSADDDGQALARSPFLDDVRDLLDPRPPFGEEDLLEDDLTRRRHLSEVVFTPARAPSGDELARALAALGPDGAGLGEISAADGATAELGERLAIAAERAEDQPGPLEVPEVLRELGERELFGASSLELFAQCSYRWFVDRQLLPQGLDPDPEARSEGSTVHDVLEELYREPPAGEGVPRPATVEEWIARSRELLAKCAAERGLAPVDAPTRASYRRMEAAIERFLRRESGIERPIVPAAELIEASFGDGEDDQRGPLELDGIKLHGKIDRVDVAPPGKPEAGLIRDYKTSTTATAGAKLPRERKLQLQLYMEALRQLWGIRPIGGVYHPLRATKDDRARGLLLSDELEGLLGDEPFYNPDCVSEEELDRAMESARAAAVKIAARIRAGDIRRDPYDPDPYARELGEPKDPHVCPRYCSFQPICRRERGARIERTEELGEGEEDAA